MELPLRQIEESSSATGRFLSPDDYQNKNLTAALTWQNYFTSLSRERKRKGRIHRYGMN